MMRSTLLILLLFLIPQFTGWAESVLSQELSPAIKSILSRNQLKEEVLSYSFKNLDDPKDTSAYLAEDPFVPASITKIFTAVYGLKTLGAEFQFETSLHYTGKIENGVLKGDLYLVGTGDPSLTMARLMDLCMDLRQKGVKKVSGNFFYDDSDLPPITELSSFGNGDQTYNPGLSALNLEFNRITLYREGSKNTKDAQFIPMPPMIHMQVQKSKEAFPLGTRYRFREEVGGEVWEVSEKERYNLYEDIPIRRPSRRTAETFRTLSQLWGITLPPSRRGNLPQENTLLGKDKSQPLIRLLALTLEYSNNLYAEQILLKATGKKSIKDAAEVLSQWLSKSVPTCTGKLVNGSGLTSEHKLTSQCLVDFLEKYALSAVSSRGFMSLLSINGQSGWLKGRLRHPDTNFRVWAKTGSLDYVSNMAGVLFTNSGKRFAFSLSLSNNKNRELIDQAIELEKKEGENPLARKSDALKKKARYWSMQAKRAGDELLKHFIQTL